VSADVTMPEGHAGDIPELIRLLAQLLVIAADFAIDSIVQARGRGAVSIALLANEANLPALDFYDRFCFTRTRRVWLGKALD